MEVLTLGGCGGAISASIVKEGAIKPHAFYHIKVLFHGFLAGMVMNTAI